MKTCKEYNNNIDNWEFLNKAYEGSINYINTSTLMQYRSEAEKDYTNRKNRAVYINYFKHIVDSVIDYIFKNPIKRITSKILERINNNYDGNNIHVNNFMRELMKYLRVFGKVGILIDKTNIIPTTAAEEYEYALPYAQLLSPICIINWDVDKQEGIFSTLNWVAIKYKKIENYDYKKEAKEIIMIRVWTKNNWIDYDENDKEINRSEHKLGRCPIIIINYKSTIQTIAELNKKCMNWESSLDECMLKGVYSMLAIPSSGDQQEQYQKIITGYNTAFEYDGRYPAPSFLTPAQEPARVLLENIQYLIAEMYRLAGLEKKDASATSKLSSGISKIIDFIDTNSMLCTWADLAEIIERQITSIMLQYMNQEFNINDINYPDSFNITDLDEDINNLITLQNVGYPQIFMKELKKIIASKILYNQLNSKQLNDINEAIDEWDEDEFYSPESIKSLTKNKKLIDKMEGINA